MSFEITTLKWTGSVCKPEWEPMERWRDSMSKSKKTVAQKLLIKENYRVLLVNEPKGYKSILGVLPANVTVLTEPGEPVDLIQVFVTSRREVEEQLPRLKSLLKSKGLLWVTYPKGTPKVAREREVDINRDSIWKFAQSIG